VAIDCQHGLVGIESLVGMLQALALTSAPPLVRVASNSAYEIGRVLDAGAIGVIVPNIESASEAQ
jgi:4-hydroxy-2-oxoheptanedioate aldolase